MIYKNTRNLLLIKKPFHSDSETIIKSFIRTPMIAIISTIENKKLRGKVMVDLESSN